MRHDTVTMREWLASVPDPDLISIIAVTPALRRARTGDLDDLRARIREFSEQQIDGLAHAFLAGVAQQLRSDGFAQAEIDAPGPEDLRAMLIDHLPAAHARLALHALLIGSGPASATARAHATHLLTALDEELPITATTHDTPLDRSTAAGVVEKLRSDAAALAPGLRAAADAVDAGAAPADAALTAEALRRFADDLNGLLADLGPIDGPADLAGIDAHLERLAEQEQVAAERALVLDHRAEVHSMAQRLESDGGPAFLREQYAALLAEIDRELAGPRYGGDPLTRPFTEDEARALLTSTGIDDELVAVLQPWPLLCEPGDHIPRGDVSEVVTAEASTVPDLLKRLETLGVLHENAEGEVALDELTLRCLSLLPTAG